MDESFVAIDFVTAEVITGVLKIENGGENNYCFYSPT